MHMKNKHTHVNPTAPTTEASGNSPKDMRAMLAEQGPDAIRAAISKAEIHSPNDALPWIKIHGEGRTLGQFAGDVGEAAGRGNVYQRGDVAFRVSEADAELKRIDPQEFRTYVEKFAVICEEVESKDGPVRQPCSIGIETSRAVCVSPQFLEKLPPLRGVLPVSMPVLRSNGKIELLDPGYDEESRYLTLANGCKYPSDITADQAKKYLEKLLREFPFADKRSKGVALASMLTVFGSALLAELALVPCFIYQANAEGSGKTTLAMLAGIPYGIVSSQPAPSANSEWAKRLLTLTISGSKVTLLDNVRGHLQSQALEAYLTATTYGDRILGVSTEYKGPADAVVLITGNSLTITPDLRRRCLFVELFMTELRSEDRVFKRRLDPDGILKEQPKILAALWSLVRDWDEAGRPKGSKINASFASWSEIVGGIVEHAGYACPTEHAELKEGGDTTTRDIGLLADELDVDTSYRFSDLLDLCLRRELFEHITEDRDILDQPSKKAKSRLASLFKSYTNRHIAVGKILTASGTGHGRYYAVKAPD